MFATRKNRAERTTAQAWEYLSDAMASAAAGAREAGKQAATTADRANRRGHELADETSRRGRKIATRIDRRSQKLTKQASKKGHKFAGRANRAADEAWARANAAAGALAGNRQGRPWGLIAGAGLLGLVAGWAVATTARAALEREAESEQLELAETALVVTPTYEDKQ